MIYRAIMSLPAEPQTAVWYTTSLDTIADAVQLGAMCIEVRESTMAELALDRLDTISGGSIPSFRNPGPAVSGRKDPMNG